MTLAGKWNLVLGLFDALSTPFLKQALKYQSIKPWFLFIVSDIYGHLGLARAAHSQGIWSLTHSYGFWMSYVLQNGRFYRWVFSPVCWLSRL